MADQGDVKLDGDLHAVLKDAAGRTYGQRKGVLKAAGHEAVIGWLMRRVEDDVLAEVLEQHGYGDLVELVDAVRDRQFGRDDRWDYDPGFQPYAIGDRTMTDGGMVMEGDYQCVTCGDPLNIVGIVQHDCPRILSVENLSTSEQNTLLYVENCVVDHRGQLDPEKMNFEDRQNLKIFHAAGILEVAEQEGERVKMRDGMGWKDQVTTFTDAAWDLARDCRKARASRTLDNPDEVLDGDGDGA